MDKKAFRDGLRDGVPIGLGYFVVAFSLGITAKSLGFNWIQAFVVSLTNLASAGEYAGFQVIEGDGTYFEMVLMIIVANCRYMLMSTALSQRVSPKMKGIHRFTISSFITDELFALNIAREGDLKPSYAYGTYLASGPAWAAGTAIGVVAGNILPGRIVSALGVALFGMFIAIIIPPAKKDKVVAALVVISFALSYASGALPKVKELSSGMRIIILTVIISAAAAILFPVKEEESSQNTAEEEEKNDA